MIVIRSVIALIQADNSPFEDASKTKSRSTAFKTAAKGCPGISDNACTVEVEVKVTLSRAVESGFVNQIN